MPEFRHDQTKLAIWLCIMVTMETVMVYNVMNKEHTKAHEVANRKRHELMTSKQNSEFIVNDSGRNPLLELNHVSNFTDNLNNIAYHFKNFTSNNSTFYILKQHDVSGYSIKKSSSNSPNTTINRTSHHNKRAIMYNKEYKGKALDESDQGTPTERQDVNIKILFERKVDLASVEVIEEKREGGTLKDSVIWKALKTVVKIRRHLRKGFVWLKGRESL